jgi:diguanylate cyclase (GGDEF)-like protein
MTPTSRFFMPSSISDQQRVHFMISRLAAFLGRASKVRITLLSITFIMVVGAVDLSTDVELHFFPFYFVPVGFMAWFVSRNTGILLALLCTLTEFATDLLGGRSYSSAWIPLWNLIIHAGAFTMAAIVLSQVRLKLDAISQLATHDLLTGLPNGRAFYELATHEMRVAFDLEPLTLAYVDVEGLEWINHRLGYCTGDQMLCTIAQTIKQIVPRPDLLARIGGTSFAVLLPDTTSEKASSVLDAIQRALKEQRRRHAQPVTFFISAIACARAPGSIAELLHQAETKMSRMKGSTRDAIEITHIDSAPSLN